MDLQIARDYDRNLEECEWRPRVIEAMSNHRASLASCQSCGKETTKRCSGCVLGPRYCSRDCQFEDWAPRHKVNCGFWKEVNYDEGDGDGEDEAEVAGAGSGLGLHYIAAKDIPAGEPLFQKHPLVIIPRLVSEVECSYTHWMKECLDEGIVPGTCLGCYEIAADRPIFDTRRGMLLNSCSACGWPVHNAECEKRHQVECEIFTAHNVQYSKYKSLDYNVFLVGLLRAVMLKKSDPSAWAMLMKLKHCHNSIMQTNVDQNSVYLDFIFTDCKLDFLTPAELMETVSIVLSNRLRVNHRHSRTTMYADIIYEGNGDKGMVLNHSCFPNTMAYIDRDGVATFRTLTPVDKGQVLTINYDGFSPPYIRNYYQRFSHFTRLGYPLCSCRLCNTVGVLAGVTEDGLLVSAMKCARPGCTGLCLPITVTAMWDMKSPKGIWRCNSKAPSCHFSINESDWADKEKEIGEMLLQGGGTMHFRSRLRSELGKGVLPANNYLMQRMNVEIGRLTMGEVSKKGCEDGAIVTEEELGFYVTDLALVLANMDKFQPGRHTWKGYVSLFLALLQLGELCYNVPPLEDFCPALTNIRLALSASMDILEEDPLTTAVQLTKLMRLQKVYYDAFRRAVHRKWACITFNPVFEELRATVLELDFDLKWNYVFDHNETPGFVVKSHYNKNHTLYLRPKWGKRADTVELPVTDANKIFPERLPLDMANLSLEN